MACKRVWIQHLPPPKLNSTETSYSAVLGQTSLNFPNREEVVIVTSQTCVLYSKVQLRLIPRAIWIEYCYCTRKSVWWISRELPSARLGKSLFVNSLSMTLKRRGCWESKVFKNLTLKNHSGRSKPTQKELERGSDILCHKLWWTRVFFLLYRPGLGLCQKKYFRLRFHKTLFGAIGTVLNWTRAAFRFHWTLQI